MITDNNCPLCKALQNEKDKFIHEEKDMVILSTKYMKGHHKRIMLIPKRHIPYEKVSKIEDRNWSVRFIAFCRDYFDEEPTFAICGNDFCTVPDHFHIIACDWFGAPEEIQQLHYTSHVAIKTKVTWKPTKVEK